MPWRPPERSFGPGPYILGLRRGARWGEGFPFEVPAVAALITHATGVTPYFVGKPNPLMMRSGLNALGGHSETTAMIGDRMDTDVVAGLEAGLHTILVLSGVTTARQAQVSAVQADAVASNLAAVADLLGWKA